MVDSIEKKIDVPAGAEWSEKRKEYIPAKPISLEKEEKEINTIDIEKAYDQTEEEMTKWNEKQKDDTNFSTNNKETIKQLDRPEAEEGIAQAYTNIETTIKNSSQDKNPVARFMGKIINRINPTK